MGLKTNKFVIYSNTLILSYLQKRVYTSSYWSLMGIKSYNPGIASTMLYQLSHTGQMERQEDVLWASFEKH